MNGGPIRCILLGLRFGMAGASVGGSGTLSVDERIGSMATAETGGAAKVCIVCGANVAGKPRVKDAAGRYMCAGECQKKAEAESLARSEARERAKLQPPPPPKAGPVVKSAAAAKESNLLGDLISSSPMINAAACTACGNPMPGGAVVCTRCGFNSQTGKNLKTAVIKEKEKKEAKLKPQKYNNKYAMGEVGTPFWKIFVIETVILSAVGCLPLVGAEGFTIGYIIIGLASLVAWIGGTIAAFKNDQTLWGICGIGQIVPILNLFAAIGFLIYNLLFNEDKNSRALYLASLIGFVVFGIMMGVAIALGRQFVLFGTNIGGP